ncbi:hypothetical protein [Campylobacter corcagiensis]|uniref:Uncharacterized protein n=1 Tax=Campylobacter corcagiensis TaxID=1448857 RepID=A0A7M1LIX1_9BACT|nr:hypothetical protein [Campylobacter corcagiensis]QOQ87455.1 hypothetical protein IMC76_01145 [Campylobacter corcagiensis]
MGFIFSGCNGGEVRTKAYFANNPDEINSLDCNKEKLSKKEQKECDNAMEISAFLSMLKTAELSYNTDKNSYETYLSESSKKSMEKSKDSLNK